jgi:thioredoxin reductase
MSLYDVAIIGGGPSGLAAATYTSSFQLRTVVIAPDLGGKVNYEFRLQEQKKSTPIWGLETVQTFAQAVQAQAVDHETSEVTAVTKDGDGDGPFQVTLASGMAIQARAVIVATGAKPQRLYVPGEQEFWGKGLSFSAISHAPFFVNRTVAVVGNTQRTQVAILKLATVAKQIYWISSTTHEASEAPLRQLEGHPKVTPLYGWEVQRILGRDYVAAIEIAAGYTVREVPVDGIFIEMGLIPNIEFVRGLIAFDPETGHIPVNQRCETALPGLFAAGDVTDVYSEQITVALGEGVKAAISAWEYLATL